MHYFDNEAAWEAFRAEAESWLGTPYRHLQRCKGRGADCTLFVGQALLDAGLHLGEGTGGALGAQLLDNAVAAYNETAALRELEGMVLYG